MPYTFTNDPVQLVRNYNAYAYGGAPEIAKERLQTICGSQADVISQGREILYAHKDLLDEEGLSLLAQLAAYAVANNWIGDNADGRCEKIVSGARRELGEAGDWVAEEDEPQPKTTYRNDGVNWKGATLEMNNPPPDPIVVPEPQPTPEPEE